MSNAMVPSQLVWSNVVSAHSPKGVAVRQSRVPFLLAALYTLDVSWRVLWNSFRGISDDEQIRLADGLLFEFAARVFRSGNGTLNVTGREHFEGRQPYMIMSNHTSLLDIPALFGAVPHGRLRMVFKQELARVPVWGRACLAAGFVPVDRKNRKKAIEQLEVAKRTLQKGVHVWISPEGTRSRDGTLLPFKKGGFHTAAALQLPIMPAYIDGTAKIISPDVAVVRYDQTASVRFGKPIPTVDAEGNVRDMATVMEEVRAAILQLKH
jgi:1-acyl-sn-glycerol-3-phosphate acyltransferase